MSMSLRTMVTVVLIALAVGAPSAAAATTKQETARGAAAPRTTTVVKETPATDDRSAPFTVLLVGVGASVGVIVGVIPALVAAVLLGYLPPPRLRRRGGMLVEPPRPEPAPVPERAPLPEPVVLAAAANANANATVAAVPDPPAETPRSGQLAILAHARHQSVYDAAYAEQLDRVHALRSAIGGRRGKPSEPPAE